MRRIRRASVLASAAVQPGRWLIEQQQDRLERQRPGEADQLLHAERQRADGRIAVRRQAGKFQYFLGSFAVAQLLAPHAGKKQHLGENIGGDAAMPSGQDVFQNRHLRKYLAVLEGAGDTEPGDIVRGAAVDVVSARAG